MKRKARKPREFVIVANPKRYRVTEVRQMIDGIAFLFQWEGMEPGMRYIHVREVLPKGKKR